MTEKIDNARRPDAHPDLTLIAAHADRRLAGEERSRMDQHLAQCSRCFEIYSETLLFKEDTEPQPKGGSRVIPFLAKRPAFQIAAGLAAALVLAAGLSFVGNRSGFRVLPASPVAELVQAVGERRLVEPRLTGGFRYGRLLVMRSGEGPQGLDAQPPAVLAAVARIRERAEKDPSPEALGALGVTYLVSGDVGAAVKALESATAQKTDDPRLWSDLAAAYLARARQADEPADIPKALEAAERAIELKDPPVEAWFNRALALEALHLDDAAKKAWEDYIARDATSGWADEARQHLEALAAKPRQSSVEEERARVRAALEEGSAAVGRLADESPQMLRDYLDNDLLPAWADATLVGHPDAKLNRNRARVVGEAL
ncbi:MAG TPA: zf-HC2 domain-containing protein, partial [Vicinamibacteria bacterium]